MVKFLNQNYSCLKNMTLSLVLESSSNKEIWNVLSDLLSFTQF